MSTVESQKIASSETAFICCKYRHSSLHKACKNDTIHTALHEGAARDCVGTMMACGIAAASNMQSEASVPAMCQSHRGVLCLGLLCLACVAVFHGALIKGVAAICKCCTLCTPGATRPYLPEALVEHISCPDHSSNKGCVEHFSFIDLQAKRSVWLLPYNQTIVARQELVPAKLGEIVGYEEFACIACTLEVMCSRACAILSASKKLCC